MSMVKMAAHVYGVLGWLVPIAGKEPIITWDPKELADAVREVLEQGSINLTCSMVVQTLVS